jgi:hypothetical protein
MVEHPLVLSDEEQQYLRTRLKSALEEIRVESHHTRTLAYRERVRREEAVLRGLLAKLGVAVPASPQDAMGMPARPQDPMAVAAAADRPEDRWPRGLDG